MTAWEGVLLLLLVACFCMHVHSAGLWNKDRLVLVKHIEDLSAENIRLQGLCDTLKQEMTELRGEEYQKRLEEFKKENSHLLEL